jgi:hypothetical protein
MAAPQSGVTGCQLGSPTGTIRHVIYMQFDNTHFTRDNPNVPSDLEQMPHLLNFIEQNGVLLSNHHTPLIAHTADDIVASETGLYPNRHGMPIANEYNYYLPDGTTDSAGSFAYWTDPIVDYNTSTSAPVGDNTPTMVTPAGLNTPAPWVPYTRAGCNVGSVAAANTELENTVPDVATVFGPNSVQAQEAADPNQQNQAAADFMGLSIHCAQGSSVCSPVDTAVPDRLPNEPGGYSGYSALFGNKYIQPVIHPGSPVTDLYGNVIQDQSGDVGFPGYNGMIGANALAYTADMQEHGVPVTLTYLSDMHESWQTGNALGPGETTYEQQLAAEDHAFATFFQRLQNDGITTQNALFVITADEGDHFVGGAPSPGNCNGVKIACTYSQIGELEGNLNGLLATELGVTNPAFDVKADSAPEFYVHNQPARTDPGVRSLERAVGGLTAPDLITGHAASLTNYLADPVELRLLHMITGDPKRTPTFAMFGNTDFYLSSGSPDCSTPCVSEYPPEAWNHGTVEAQINTTWIGFAGPGVVSRGVDGTTWSDETDTRPTMLTLLGLRDSYQDDGLPIFQIMSPSVLPRGIERNLTLIDQLQQVYKQLEAPVGTLGLASLKISTQALESGSSAHDDAYTSLEDQLSQIDTTRNVLAALMQDVILDDASHGNGNDTHRLTALISKGQSLISQVTQLASSL